MVLIVVTTPVLSVAMKEYWVVLPTGWGMSPVSKCVYSACVHVCMHMCLHPFLRVGVLDNVCVCACVCICGGGGG